MGSGNLSLRNLSKADLGGVIFGCTHDTMRECLISQLFGLPGPHISYVQNIEPGLPLFLFNYSDRKLYGIFEAESPGQWNINPYGWSPNGSEKTKFPAQVRIRTRMQCEPLLEKQFKPIIADNYHTAGRFCFEVDRNQAHTLISMFGSSPVIGGSAKWFPTVAPNLDAAPEEKNASTKWIPKVAPNPDAALQIKDIIPPVSLEDFSYLDQSNMNREVLSKTPLYEENQLAEIYSNREEVESEHLIYLKLMKLALQREHTNSSPIDSEADIVVPRDTNAEQPEDESSLETLSGAANKNEETSISSVIHQLTQEMKELKSVSREQLQQTCFMGKKMAESKSEIQQLKDRVQRLESRLNSSTNCTDEAVAKTFDVNQLSGDQRIYLLGGYNGNSWLSSLDCYSLSRDALRSLRPMSTIRSHAAASTLDGHIYIFGGGNGDMWYNTVESYNPVSDKWTSCPPLSVEKGNLAGAALHGKLFAIGGGNRDLCLSDVEMFDPFHGRWVRTQSMLQKRFAPASAVLNGALYAVGGYDGESYLNSAERFDPRENLWERLPSMNTRRGCHSLVSFNEKLYAFGGYDGTGTVSSVEVLDPRFGSWTNNDPMNESRGYAGAVVVGESICVIGGVQSAPNIADTVECYKEGSGWLFKRAAIGKRCFFSAVVL